MADPLDIGRVKRAFISTTFMTRSGGFRSEWQGGLAKLIAKRLPKGEEGALRAKIIASLALEVHETALQAWIRSDGKQDIVKNLSQALEAIRGVGADELPARLDRSILSTLAAAQPHAPAPRVKKSR